MRGHWEKGRYVVGNSRTGSWSKWGGARQGEIREELPEWMCQVCGKKQLKVFPEYLIPLDDETLEYLRICTECQFRSVVSKSYSFTRLHIEVMTKSLNDYRTIHASFATLSVLV